MNLSLEKGIQQRKLLSLEQYCILCRRESMVPVHCLFLHSQSYKNVFWCYKNITSLQDFCTRDTRSNQHGTLTICKKHGKENWLSLYFQDTGKTLGGWYIYNLVYRIYLVYRMYRTPETLKKKGTLDAEGVKWKTSITSFGPGIIGILLL